GPGLWGLFRGLGGWGCARAEITWVIAWAKAPEWARAGGFVFILFYVEPVGDVCLTTGRALGCLMVLFLGGRAGMTRSLIMSLTVDLVSLYLVVYACVASGDRTSCMPV